MRWNLFGGSLVINHLIVTIRTAFEFTREGSQVHLVNVSSHLEHSLAFGRLVVVDWSSQLVNVGVSISVSLLRNKLHFVRVCSDVPIPVAISFFSQSLLDAAVYFESSEHFVTHAGVVKRHRIVSLYTHSLHLLRKQGQWSKSFSLKGQKAENGWVSCHLAFRLNQFGSLL